MERILHKWLRCYFTLIHLLPKGTHTQLCVCVCLPVQWLLFLLLNVVAKEGHVNIYIGFRKQLLLRKNLFVFTQIQNKETSLKLPVIDMWACFSSHWLEEVSVWDLFLTGLKLLVARHISEQLLDTEVFKVMGTVCLRDGEVSKPLEQNNFPFD